MKQVSLKLKMYMGSASIINNDVERITLHFILWSFGALAFFYVLLLGNMVFNIVERRGLENSARSLEGEVRNLELAYLSMSNNVDLAFSQSLGFREVKTNFATRKALGSLGGVEMLQNDI